MYGGYAVAMPQQCGFGQNAVGSGNSGGCDARAATDQAAVISGPSAVSGLHDSASERIGPDLVRGPRPHRHPACLTIGVLSALQVDHRYEDLLLAGSGARKCFTRQARPRSRRRLSPPPLRRACRGTPGMLARPPSPPGERRRVSRAGNPGAASPSPSRIVDEVFSDYSSGSDLARVATAVAHRGALTFVLNGLSKTAGLPQLKLSWISVWGPPWLEREALDRLELISDACLSVSSPVQPAAGSLLAQGGGIRRQILERLALPLRRPDAPLRSERQLDHRTPPNMSACISSGPGETAGEAIGHGRPCRLLVAGSPGEMFPPKLRTLDRRSGAGTMGRAGALHLERGFTGRRLATEGGAMGGSDQGPRRVLLVDDDADFVQSMTLVLENAGLEVDSAMNGAEAIQAARVRRPDLIVLDMLMPK